MALCLAVAPVMAGLSVANIPQTAQINATLTASQTVNYGEYPSLDIFNNGNWYCSQSDYNKLHSVATSSYTITSLWKTIGAWQNGPIVDRYYYNIIVNIEPTPDPTLQPTAPYITATVYNTGANNAYYDYNVRCMPAENYFFAPLSFYSYGGQLPQCDLTSEETSIQVRVFAGEDIPIYSCALSGSGGVPNFQYIQR